MYSFDTTMYRMFTVHRPAHQLLKELFGRWWPLKSSSVIITGESQRHIQETLSNHNHEPCKGTRKIFCYGSGSFLPNSMR